MANKEIPFAGSSFYILVVNVCGYLAIDVSTLSKVGSSNASVTLFGVVWWAQSFRRKT